MLFFDILDLFVAVSPLAAKTVWFQVDIYLRLMPHINLLENLMLFKKYLTSMTSKTTLLNIFKIAIFPMIVMNYESQVRRDQHKFKRPQQPGVACVKSDIFVAFEIQLIATTKNRIKRSLHKTNNCPYFRYFYQNTQDCMH